MALRSNAAVIINYFRQFSMALDASMQLPNFFPKNTAHDATPDFLQSSVQATTMFLIPSHSFIASLSSVIHCAILSI